MKTSSKPRIAFWFRYGPADHAELFHAIPAIVEQLADKAEIHYFGLKTKAPIPETLQRHVIIHTLPLRVDRANNRDKVWKTLFWIISIPWLAIYCRLLKIRAIYIDENVPLVAPLAHLFFGSRIALTIADFFIEIYEARSRAVRLVGPCLKAMDYYTWRRLPLIFTRAKNTRAFLAEHGIASQRIFPVYDPCDFTVYHPADRSSARRALHLPQEAVILVHHGILHPNKGNDRILRSIAEHRDRFPDLIYLLIGDGPDMPRLRALTSTLNLEDCVRFTGWLPTLAEVNQALNAGDIGLVMRIGQPSDDFHMTGALVHSMACGLPVLAAHLAGVAEVIANDRNGLLFNPHTLADFPSQLARLYSDATYRNKLGDQALKDAYTNFDMDTVTLQTITPLQALLNIQNPENDTAAS